MPIDGSKSAAKINNKILSVSMTFLRVCPTVRVTCVWAGVDTSCEQEKPEARTKPENGENPTRQVHALLDPATLGCDIISQRL